MQHLKRPRPPTDIDSAVADFRCTLLKLQGGSRPSPYDEPARPAAVLAQALPPPARTLGALALSSPMVPAPPLAPLPLLPPLTSCLALGSRGAAHAQLQAGLAATAAKYRRNLAALHATYDGLLAQSFGEMEGLGRPLAALRPREAERAPQRALPAAGSLPPISAAPAHMRAALEASAAWREEISRPAAPLQVLLPPTPVPTLQPTPQPTPPPAPAPAPTSAPRAERATPGGPTASASAPLPAPCPLQLHFCAAGACGGRPAAPSAAARACARAPAPAPAR